MKSKNFPIFDLLLQGHIDWVRCVKVTSDIKYIISCSADKKIRLWNLLENRQETVLQGHTSSVECVTVTSDNKYIVSCSFDSTIRIWNLLDCRQEAVLKEILIHWVL